jgi:quinoprotein glucose dehydrogenase
MFPLRIYYFFIVVLLSCKGKNNNTWTVAKADAESTSYSPLDQINKSNVSKLQVAWAFHYDDAKEGARFNGSQCNPIVIDDVMYVASVQRTIFALEAGTGKKIWSFDPFNGGRGGGSFRGVTYWEKGDDKRILFTAGDNLFAINAKDGKPVTTFGKDGKVSMNIGIRDDSSKISIKPTSPGIIYKDLIIIGNEVSELYGAQPGYIRAYNVITGKLTWTFHTIPLPGEFGYDTWPKDAWKYAGGANCWGGMSLDEKRGMVFLGTGSPTYDFYGADRKGINLFGNCIIALDAATGNRKWHFQTIHHDLWDYDLPSPPNLVTIKKDGKNIDAVAQTSKVGFLYVLDRETGEPLYPIEERPVPASDVPGENIWPTQPYVLKPKPYSKQTFSVDDLSHFSDSTHDSTVRYFKSLRYDGLFTPPSVRGTFVYPGTIGGSEWGGAAYDPESSIIYLKSNESPEISKLVKIEKEIPGQNNNDPAKGREIYMTYCAVCHKANLKGEEPLYPSLVALHKRLTEDQALTRIREGAGKMPPFKAILGSKEKALIAFLFEKNRRERTQKDYDVEEMKRNLSILGDSSGKKSDTNDVYINVAAYAIMRDADGNPFIKAPWATLNAIDLNTGEYVWTVPAGNNDKLRKKGDPPTGATGSPGPIVTKGGLVFLGGSRDHRFQAYDKDNGKILWDLILPGTATSIAGTYMSKGKQYIAISVAGNEEHSSGSVMTFALPD